jgi:hypothetical protein
MTSRAIVRGGRVVGKVAEVDAKKSAIVVGFRFSQWQKMLQLKYHLTLEAIAAGKVGKIG